MQACRLSATDLACRRGDRVLFTGLSLDLPAGSALHVAGANGLGKSSLIRIVAGLLRPMSGIVESQGTMGLLDERPALDQHQPLGQALAFWQRLDGPADERLSQLGPKGLGLADLLDVPVRYLSTGQKKRAALARLAAAQAPIWLLDEPLNGLDSHAVTMVQHMVSSHCGAGGIAVIASHQPIAVAGMAQLDLLDYVP